MSQPFASINGNDTNAHIVAALTAIISAGHEQGMTADAIAKLCVLVKEKMDNTVFVAN